MIFAVSKLSDFPERVDPMTVKELRQGLRARKFVIPFACLHLLMLAVCTVEYLVTLEGSQSAVTAGATTFLEEFSEPIEAGYLFWAVVAFLLWLVMPATRFFDMQQEYDGRNAELLLMSDLTRWKIVKGKWIMACSISLLTFISVLPYLLLRYFYGGFEILENAILATCILLISAVVSALIIGASAYRNYIGRIALILSALGVLALTMVAPTVGAIGLLNEATSWLWVILIVADVAAVAVFFCVLGMQLARVKLRTFEDPYDPAPGSQVIILYLFAPLLIGIPAIFTMGFGGIPAAAFFTWIACNIDPPPKKGKRAHYAQQ